MLCKETAEAPGAYQRQLSPPASSLRGHIKLDAVRTTPHRRRANYQPRRNGWLNTVVSSDVDVVVNSAGQLLGMLAVSKGSIDWIARGSQSRRRPTWEVFAELMKEHGRQVRKPTTLSGAILVDELRSRCQAQARC